MLLVLLAACVTEPQPRGIAGNYALVAVAGRPLPTPTRYYVGSNAYDGTITAGLLVMGADSTLAETQSVTDAYGRAVPQQTALGRWHHLDPASNAYQIEMAGSSLGWIATLHGDTLAFIDRTYVRR